MTNRILSILFALLLWQPCAALPDGQSFVLVIDAGHGGKDPGALGSFSREKNICLNVALAFGRLVERNCPDVRVVYTRKTDVFVELDDRAAIANRAKADLFISIHVNAVEGNRSAAGSETYTLGMHRAADNLAVAKRENSVISYEKDYKTRYEGFDPNKAESYVIFEFMQDKFMKQSVDLASCIQQQYARSGRRNKGVHQAGFLVLRKTSMPAVLTELGFITTPEEEQYLNSDAGVQTIASCIYNGFLNYRKLHGAKNLPAPVAVADTQPAPPAATAVAETPQPAEKKAVEKKSGDRKAVEKNTSPKNSTKKKSSPAPAAPKQKVTSTQPAPQATTDKGTIYRIQFASTLGKADPADKRFKGMKDVYSYKEGKYTKHTTGRYTSLAEARNALAEIRKTLPDAFIVKFIDGKRQ